MNKAGLLAATVLVACSYLVGRVLRWHDDDARKKLVVVKFCGLIGFSFAALHAIASLCVLTPAYFAKYFSADGRLNVRGRIGAGRRDRRPVGSFAAGDHNAPHDAEGASKHALEA